MFVCIRLFFCVSLFVSLSLKALRPMTSPTPPNRIDLIRPDAPPRAALGPHGVGRLTLELINPDVPRVVNLMTGQGPARADRALTVEMFYPAKAPVTPTPIQTELRDGTTTIELWGISAQGAEPAQSPQSFPLIVISHGYPGNRFLLAHLAENLASKGYAVASIDHRDSTYTDLNIREAVAIDRPRDIHFVLQALTGEPQAADDAKAQVQAAVLERVSSERIGLVGYSMGGYGVLMAQGAQLAPPMITQVPEPAAALVQGLLLDTDTPSHQPDPRVAAMIAVAPWGRQMGILDPRGLAKITTPSLIIGGTADSVSDYDKGIRQIWQDCTGADRALLSFEGAQHNAAAPIPAPAESYAMSPTLDFPPFEHYADLIWDSVRMNNIFQHAATGLFDHYVKASADAPSLQQASEEPSPAGTRMEFLARS